MSIIEMENEQWKLNGDCSKCRRRDYCSKPCTKHNQRATQMIHDFVAKKIIETLVSHKER